MKRKQQVTGFICPSEANIQLSGKGKRDFDESLQDLINFAKKEVESKNDN